MFLLFICLTSEIYCREKLDCVEIEKNALEIEKWSSKFASLTPFSAQRKTSILPTLNESHFNSAISGSDIHFDEPLSYRSKTGVVMFKSISKDFFSDICSEQDNDRISMLSEKNKNIIRFKGHAFNIVLLGEQHLEYFYLFKLKNLFNQKSFEQDFIFSMPSIDKKTTIGNKNVDLLLEIYKEDVSMPNHIKYSNVYSDNSALMLLASLTVVSCNKEKLNGYKFEELFNDSEPKDIRTIFLGDIHKLNSTNYISELPSSEMLIKKGWAKIDIYMEGLRSGKKLTSERVNDAFSREKNILGFSKIKKSLGSDLGQLEENTLYPIQKELVKRAECYQAKGIKVHWVPLEVSLY